MLLPLHGSEFSVPYNLQFLSIYLQIQLGKRPAKQKGKPEKRAKTKDTSQTISEKIPAETTTGTVKHLDPEEALKSVHIGDYLAMNIFQYKDELPQIGKVLKIDASRVEIDWLIGSYSGIFTFWKERGVVIRDIYPLCGVMFPVKFTQSMRLEKTYVSTLFSRLCIRCTTFSATL